MATYRKNRAGKWVVFGPIAEVQPGLVTVTKRDGSTAGEQVDSCGRSFDVDGVPHCYGYIVENGNGHQQAPQPPHPPTPRRQRAQRRNNGRGTRRCAECGRAGATELCPDSSGIMGYCCPRCANEPEYTRSYA